MHIDREGIVASARERIARYRHEARVAPGHASARRRIAAAVRALAAWIDTAETHARPHPSGSVR